MPDSWAQSRRCQDVSTRPSTRVELEQKMTGFGILSRMRSHLTLLAGPILWFGLLAFEARGLADGSDAEFFEKRVRPVLVERCYACHGEKIQWGGLRVDSA